MKNTCVLVFQVLREHQLYAKLSKCDFYQKEIQYLGHIISNKGISMDLEKLKAIMDWPTPIFVYEIRSLYGSCWLLQKVYKGFSQIVYPITSLQKKGGSLNGHNIVRKVVFRF
jgi:hypothetical protein